MLRLLVVLLAFAASSTGAARGAEPFEINVLLPLTGTGAFIGAEQLVAVHAIEELTNRTGGIRGRPVRFVVGDEQSNPQTAIQLVDALRAKGVPLILGPTMSASCNAVLPLVQRDGPLQYCLANGVRPPAGGYTFSSLFSTDDMLGVAIRYFRERGWTRLATVVSTDATGHDAEAAIDAALAQPENRGVQIVDREHFALADISVAAQMARIKAAAPQALIAWATGTPAGTLFHGAFDAGLDLPTITSPGNLNYAWTKQYATFLPANVYFSAIPYFARDAIADRATSAANATFARTLEAVNAKPDQIHASTWDPIVLAIDALRKLGPDATAVQLRDYLDHLRGWTGILGRYDFVAIPQRGIGRNAVVIVRWDAARGTWVGVSKLGGGLQ